jgi:hypothetical protein
MGVIVQTLNKYLTCSPISVQSLDKRSTNKEGAVKKFDVLAAALIVVGGLNWGLVAVAEFDLVATLVGLEFGETNAASRVVYGLVGLAAVYQIAQQAAIRRRWSREPRATTA